MCEMHREEKREESASPLDGESPARAFDGDLMEKKREGTAREARRATSPEKVSTGKKQEGKARALELASMMRALLNSCA